MAYVAYNNIRAFLSTGDEQQGDSASSYNILYATNFSANNTTQLKRVKRIGQELDYYIQTGPKSASISTTVIPVTGANFNQLTGFLALTGDFVSGSFVKVPNYTFKKCFLKSINFSLEPWKPMLAEMQFDSYGQSSGASIYSDAAQTADTGIISPLRGMSIVLSAPSFTQTINEYENLNFGIEVERMPNFEIGQAYPTKVSVGKITKSLQINGISNIDWLSDYTATTTITATITMADGNSFSVAGVLNSQNVSVDSNGVAKGGLQVIEEMV